MKESINPDVNQAAIFTGFFMNFILASYAKKPIITNIYANPMDLHRKPVNMAKKKNTSLNQYIIYLLSCGVGLDVRDDTISDRLDKIEKRISGLGQLEKFEQSNEFEVGSINWGSVGYFPKSNVVIDNA